MLDIEGVILAGGASRRMGSDKAKLIVEGQSIGERVVQELMRRCHKVTALGGEPISGADCIPDATPQAGPIAALAGFVPTAENVFVASCDLPRFTHEVIEDLTKKIGDSQAAIPVLNGRAQPLCALYRADAFERLRSQHKDGEARIMRWVDGLDAVFVPADEQHWGRQITNVNTPEEWEAALKKLPTST